MKCFLVLSALALAALGASGPQPAFSLLPCTGSAWLDSLYGPPEIVYADTAVSLSFAAMLHAGQDSARTYVEMKAWYPYGYLDELGMYDLAAGESVQVEWRIRFGPYEESASCVVREMILDNLAPDSSSFVIWRFWILPGSGGDVEEGHGPPAAYEEPAPTVIRRLPPGTVAFDAMGRRVLHPKPGVYFLKTTATAPPQKVLLVR
jgi:hypothetical protein